MLLSFVVLNATGRPVLEKRWRHGIPRRALDELWQAQKWGSDWEAEDRRAMICGEIEQAHHFLSLLRDAG